ncbi:hypothetical protein C8F04DRAFT_560634 [Mycena alexandri]|uniref:Uncharacterized protein n=1 Tax=Mycena alexandri TaxID=1745969 RepID=A0AAD6SVW4_9AGAR|nr:hypothetical protein C8F04DRAFT_560634 [Mycena alexandri]
MNQMQIPLVSLISTTLHCHRPFLRLRLEGLQNIMNPSTLVFAKGIADISIGFVLFAKPAMLYESFATKSLSSLTGLYITNASVAPGFNHSIACLVAAVGVGNVVAARSGPAALPGVFAMTSVWSALSLLTCALAPKAWGVSGATLLMGGLSPSLPMYFLEQLASYELGLEWLCPTNARRAAPPTPLDDIYQATIRSRNLDE